jgi:hypothetical protein
LEVDVQPLDGRYGDTNGIRIVPTGWQPQAGNRVELSADGVDPPIEYAIEFVDCDAQ